MVWGSVQRYARVSDAKATQITQIQRQEMASSKGMPAFPRLPPISRSSHDSCEMTGCHHNIPIEDIPPGFKIDLHSLNRTSLPIMSMSRFSASPRFVSGCKSKACAMCAKITDGTNLIMNRPRSYQSTNEKRIGVKSASEDDRIEKRSNGFGVEFGPRSPNEKSVSRLFTNNGQQQSHCHSRGLVWRDECRVVGGRGVDHPVFVLSPRRKKKPAKIQLSRQGTTASTVSRNYTAASRRLYLESEALKSAYGEPTPLLESSVFEYPSTTPQRATKGTSDNVLVLNHSKDKRINHTITNAIDLSISQQNNAEPNSSDSLITRLNCKSVDTYPNTVNGHLINANTNCHISTRASIDRSMSDMSTFDQIELRNYTAEGYITGSISADGIANESSRDLYTAINNIPKSISRNRLSSESNVQYANTDLDNHLSHGITREDAKYITAQCRPQSMFGEERQEDEVFIYESTDDVTSISDMRIKDETQIDKSSRVTLSYLKTDITFVETDSDRELLKPIKPTISPRRPKFSDIRETYLAACHVLKVTPTSRFLRQLHAGVKNMDISNHLLSAVDIKGMMTALTKMNRVNALTLEGNDLRDDGVSCVAQFLVNDKALEQLDLTGVSIGQVGCRDLANALSYNSTLRVLKLGGNELSETHAVHIANFLKYVQQKSFLANSQLECLMPGSINEPVIPVTNKGLKELSLDHNCLNEQGGVVLAMALARNTSLLKLDLTWNHLRRAGATAICDALRVNRTLEVLNVSWNGFSREGCRSLGRVLSENDTLRELDISANRINAKALSLLLKGLAKNDSITTLKLGRNPLTTNGAISLLESITKSEDSRISHLDLSEVPVDETFLELMKRLSQERSMTVTHGPCYRQDDAREGEVTVTDGLMRFDPVLVLFEYMKQDSMRVVDLFQLLDSDGKGKLSKAKLKEGIKFANLPLTEYAIEELLLKLDHNGDGRVEIQDMMSSYRKTNRYVVQRNTLAKSRGLREDKSLAELRDIVKQLIDERNERLLEGPDQGYAPKISVLRQDRGKRKSTGDDSNTDER